MPDGTFKYFEDKVATNIAAGMLPQRKRLQQTEETIIREVVTEEATTEETPI